MSSQSLITVKQLPIIEARIKEISRAIDEKLQQVNSLAVTPENKQTAKKIKAELGKEFNEFETARKAVKTAILEPYNKFEELYSEHIKSKYTATDEALKAKIAEIEQADIADKAEKVKRYFDELVMALPYDWVKEYVAFEKSGIKVNLSTSQTALEKQCKAYVDRIENDCTAIMSMPDCEEIMVEYVQSLDFALAVGVVNMRHQMLVEVAQGKETSLEYIQKVVEHNTEIVEALPIPVVFETTTEKVEEIFTLSFTVKATKAKLKELKDFLNKGDYDYE